MESVTVRQLSGAANLIVFEQAPSFFRFRMDIQFLIIPSC